MHRIGSIVGLVVIAACSGTGLEPDVGVLTVHGTVEADGRPLQGARVEISIPGSLFGPGQSRTGVSDEDGRFEVRLSLGGCVGWVSVDATKAGYEVQDVQTPSGQVCPGETRSVRIVMRPHATLVIRTAELPAVIPTIPYSERLEAEGGDQAYFWSLIDGALPEGLRLEGSGEVSGTTDESGTATFTVRVEDGVGQSAEGTVSITVVDGIVLQPSESCGSAPDSAIVAFDDVELRRTVRAALNTAPSEPLRCGTVAALETLDASHRAIESVRGIQNLVGLTRLDLFGNEITDATGLEGLALLAILDLGYNRITDLSPLEGLSRLDSLGLISVSKDHLAPFSDLGPLTALTALSTLDAAHNRIQDLTPLADLPHLEDVNLSWNDITDASPLAGSAALARVELSYNEISAAPALQSTVLTELSLHSNPLEDISGLAGATSLVRLDLSANYRLLTDLSPLAELVGLEELDLSGGVLKDISPLSGLPALTSLDLAENRISDLSALANMAELTWLDLEANQVTDIAALAGLESVVDLNLARNNVTDVTSLGGLTTLDLLWLGANASLSDIGPLIDNSGLVSGDVVDLTSTSVPCDAVRALRAKGVTVAADAPCD